MFIGHFAVALAAKRPAPRVSLGTLCFAAQFLDLLWPWLILGGLETVRIVPGITVVTPLDFTSYPYSHSAAAALGWGLLFAAVHWLRRRDGRIALLLAGVVFSHWLLDFATHRPDLQLWGGNPTRVGLELWRSLPGTLAVELALFALGAALYLRTTRPRDTAGRWGFWSLVAVLLVIYLLALFGPPPPSVAAIGWAGQATWLLVAWGWWVDRHRSAA